MSTRISSDRPNLLDTHVCWEVKTDSFGKVLRLRSLPAPLLTTNFLAVRGVVSALNPNGGYLKPCNLSTNILSTPPFSRPYSGCLSTNSRKLINSHILSTDKPRAKSKPSVVPDIDGLMDWYAHYKIWRK